MNDIHAVDGDVMHYLNPATLVGALGYLVLAILIALLLSRALRAAVHAALTRGGHVDKTTMSFLQQIGTVLIWIVVIILYAHLIPVLRSLGTALLAGASVASVVIGLAAQSTLGNLVAGISITIYRPFRLGDTLQVAAPTGTEIGVVESISLGYTTLRAVDGHFIVLPNSIAASQVVLNLNSTFATGLTSVKIHVKGLTDLEAARQRAISIAASNLAPGSVEGCYLAEVDNGGTTLDLRFRVSDLAERERVRSALIGELSRHFVDPGVTTGETIEIS